MVDEPIDEQNPGDEQPAIDAKTEQQQLAGLDFLTALADERADQRITAYFDQNWPAMVDEIATKIGERIDPEKVAIRAEQIFETRWRQEAAARRQAAAGGDGGGDNGQRPTASGADGDGGNDDDLTFLNNVPAGDAGDQAAPSMPISTDRKQALAIAGLRFLEDPIGYFERGANVALDIWDRRRPKTPPRNDLDLIEDLAKRRPYLIDIFATPDPMSAPDRIADAMYAGANSGMRVAEAMARHNIRDATRRPAPRFKPPKVEVEPATPTPKPTPAEAPAPTPAEAPVPTPEPTPEPVAPMAQEKRPARRRRLRDVV